MFSSKAAIRWSAAGAGLALAALLIWAIAREDRPLKITEKPVDELRVRLTGRVEIPDPARIESTGDWYYLDHISSSLAFYDSRRKEFLPMLAESWINDADGTHRFKIRPDLRFHDG